MRKTFSILGLLFVLGAVIFMPGAVSAIDVFQMALIADVSGSIDDVEYALQKQGYINAFNNTVVNIFNDPTKTVTPFYAMYGEWSGLGQQSVEVNWMLINDVTSAQAFATAINASTRNYSGSTAVQDALWWAGELIAAHEALLNPADYTVIKNIIDISGDGPRNAGTYSGTAGRDHAVSVGVDTINGLVILSNQGDVYSYYQDYVISPNPGAILLTATDFDDFSAAMSVKIRYETTGELVPLPGAVVLLGGGLFRLVGYGLRRKKTS